MVQKTAYTGAMIFDGHTMDVGHALLACDGCVEGVVSASTIPEGYQQHDLSGHLILPGFVDLQVNGGDGIMFNDAPTVDTLERIAKAHAKSGTVALLPTLITDTADKVAQAISAVRDAIKIGVSGIDGLHIEGPHLAKSRKGAHDASLIRPMEQSDLDVLCYAAQHLPSLMLTVAAETVPPEQIEILSRAGAIVSLGHSNANYETSLRAISAGARCATHLFNAMGPIDKREPGLVGAALTEPCMAAGLIADGHHVHEANVALAVAAKVADDNLFLVTDAMAPAGSSLTSFDLGGRRVTRANGRLQLEDGTLAGADLDFPTAVTNLVKFSGLPFQVALGCATRVPAKILDRERTFGTLSEGVKLSRVIVAKEHSIRGNDWSLQPILSLDAQEPAASTHV